MKKKLLALAVAGAFVAPAAMADTANVNIYGVVNASFDSISTGNSAGGSSQSATRVSSNQSRIGFKGNEDLGGGNNAFFLLESTVNADAGGNPAAGRNSYVGIGGDSWGSVLLGQNDSPYKTSTRGMDLFQDGLADNRTLMGGAVGTAGVGRSAAIQFDGRNANVIQYDSPNFSGFKASLQYIAGAEGATTAGNVKGTAYSLAGTYAAGPMTLAAAYETHDMGTATTGTMGAANGGVVNQKERAYKLAGSYTMDAITGVLVYEKTDDGFGAGGANAMGHRTWYLGGKFAVTGSDAVKLAYTNANNLGNTANTGAKQISLGYDHAMSKRTTVYALYTRLTNDSAATYALGGTSTGAVANVGADADPSAFSVGVKHSF
ncbi:MAG: porin [Nitrosomonadales bacterium]|nr:porin [Nitrosomonadales bacterium]